MDGHDDDDETLDAGDGSTRRDPRSNSPIVSDARGEDVDVEQWDPMPEELRMLDDVDESDLSDPMDGPAPTG